MTDNIWGSWKFVEMFFELMGKEGLSKKIPIKIYKDNQETGRLVCKPQVNDE